MADHKGGNAIPEIEREEHQHNLLAKRVIQIDELGNAINGSGLTAGVDFDYLGVSNVSNTDTLTFKDGGSGGTTIQTLTVNYQAGVSKISDTFTSFSWS